ncbi:PREDICTED: protein CHUP1, chloroplastic-like isoform X2 [Populus euphratica]|uniref:Protein CHUP1, chloroplastic-like isoform X2 n=1 Tax=Populus euphratica TaxID=75702 RepID=A0AAJ6SUM2_POPEU|nr:PREDICTED: protein CHUP1, chloroplastic-like isoform X2 [Populus euphratica]
MVRDKRDISPVLLKFGAALAVSIAGFLLSRLKTNRNKSSQPPHSPRSSVDVGRGRSWRRDDLQVTNRTSSSGSLTSISTEIHEDSYMLKVAVDNSKVFYPSSRQSWDEDGYLLTEFNDFMKEFDFNVHNSGTSPSKDETPRSDVETPRTFKGAEKVNYEQEIKYLKSMVKMLQDRERNLEVQMLEFYGHKEQETAVMELQNRLKINNMEAKLFALKIESLQADNRRLHDQVADHVKVVTELNAARTKIKLLKKKQRSEAEQNREQILSLQNIVSRLQEQELKSAATDSDIKMKLQRLKDLETETEELKKSHLRLHLENSELASQLESTKILANSILEDPETETLRKLGNQLRQENEDLVKEVERLQADRCTDVEELVYLRWINACLRHELRNFQPPYGKTVARDLSKSLSPRSEEKAKQLILEYANTEGMMEKGINIMEFEPDHWSSSQASYMTDLGELDDSLSPKTNHSGKTKIFHKLRRLLLGKETHNQSHGSSGGRTGATGDSDSPNGSLSVSTPTDNTSDLQSTRGQTPSFYSSRHSVDTQRTRSLENSRRNSEAGSSHWYRRFSSSRASDLSLENLLDQDLYSIEKSELVKFAEVLKDPGSRAGNGNRMSKLHRKSVSVGSFEALHRSSE